MLSNEQLKEEIKKVEVKKSKTSEYINSVERRYLDWRVSREGHSMMVEFFKDVGPGPVSLDAWTNKQSIRKAATEAGFILVRNKRTREYAIFPAGKQESDELIFDPKLLDTDHIKEVVSPSEKGII